MRFALPSMKGTNDPVPGDTVRLNKPGRRADTLLSLGHPLVKGGLTYYQFSCRVPRRGAAGHRGRLEGQGHRDGL